MSLEVLKDRRGEYIVNRIDSNRSSIAFASFLTFWYVFRTNEIDEILIAKNEFTEKKIFFFYFRSGLIIFQNILPISLYISIEFVKGVQVTINFFKIFHSGNFVHF